MVFTKEGRVLRSGRPNPPDCANGQVIVFERSEFIILGFFVTFCAKTKSKARKNYLKTPIQLRAHITYEMTHVS